VNDWAASEERATAARALNDKRRIVAASSSSDPFQRKLILGCFFVSGCAGLIYQVAWAKSLTLIFGASGYAATTVLAAFLGGLALGSDWIGRWSDRQ
jgi:predicted membrane-bound spermidine synthase